MAEPVAFKRGCDVSEERGVDEDDTVTCVDCGAVESDQRAFEAGWQLVPVTCPDCFRWTLTQVGEHCCGGGP